MKREYQPKDEISHFWGRHQLAVRLNKSKWRMAIINDFGSMGCL